MGDPFPIIEEPSITYTEIVGLESIIKQIKYKVMAKQRSKTNEGNVLLWGPPGCGHAAIARALALESKSIFMSVTPSDILNHTIDERIKKIEQILDYMKERKMVVFFEELHSLFPRSDLPFMEFIRNCFCQQIDEISTENRSIMIGSTTKPWLIHPDILKPPGFSILFFVPPPDHQTRIQLFKSKLKKLIRNDMIARNVDFDELASLTAGMSRADIIEICNRAVDRAVARSIGKLPLKISKGVKPNKVSKSDFITVISEWEPSIILRWALQALIKIKEYNTPKFKESIGKLIKQLLEEQIEKSF